MTVPKAEILEAEITRKQFLQVMAGVSLSLFGFSNLLAFIQNLLEKSPAASKSTADSSHGFGSSKFGV